MNLAWLLYKLKTSPPIHAHSIPTIFIHSIFIHPYSYIYSYDNSSPRPLTALAQISRRQWTSFRRRKQSIASSYTRTLRTPCRSKWSAYVQSRWRDSPPLPSSSSS